MTAIPPPLQISIDDWFIKYLDEQGWCDYLLKDLHTNDAEVKFNGF